MKNTFAVVKGQKEGVVGSESDYGYTRAYTRAEEVLGVRTMLILTASMSVSRPQCGIALQNVAIEEVWLKDIWDLYYFLQLQVNLQIPQNKILYSKTLT